MVYRIFLFILIIVTTLGCVSSDTRYNMRRINGVLKHPVSISIDREFSPKERELILKASKVWEKLSQGRVNFRLTWNKQKPGRYRNFARPRKNTGIFFWDLPKNEYHLTPELEEFMKTYIGLTVIGEGDNAANVIIYKNIDEDLFFTVAIHELGHLIGIHHDSNPISVMNPTPTKTCILDSTVLDLCRLYDCIPRAGIGVTRSTVVENVLKENDCNESISSFLAEKEPYPVALKLPLQR